MKNQVNSTVSNIDPGTVEVIFANYDRYMTYWHMLPYILFLVVVIYMIVMGIRRERTDEYV